MAEGDLLKGILEYLEKQGQLVETQQRLVGLQIEHFAEKRRLASGAARRKQLVGWLKSANQGLIVLAAAVAVLALSVMLAGAFTSRDVVVNEFQTPTALANRGLTGNVVASGVLDTLQELRAKTRSVSKGLNATSAWTSDVKIQVPETGVSIGEIDRLLHARFGHDVHIDGDLVQSQTGGLALTVRGDGVPAKEFRGTAGDLDKLTRQAAKYVYSCSQPYQYTAFLDAKGQYNEELAFASRAFALARDGDLRAELTNALGNAYLGENKPKQAEAEYRFAMSLKSPNWVAWNNLVNVIPLADGEEAGWRESQALLNAYYGSPKNRQHELLRYVAAAAALTLDFPLVRDSTLADAEYNGGAGASTIIDGPTLADNYALMHDPADAARFIASSDPGDPFTKAEVLLLQTYAALDRGDGAAAIVPMEAFWIEWQANPSLQSGVGDAPCLLGLAYGLAGHISAAERVFSQMGHWSRCYAMHGDVLEHAHKLHAAERIWAEGLRYGPDLAPVYLERGISELKRGDLKHAQIDLATANAKAPHYADPLKAWGDLLAREGQWTAALEKYDEARTYAPAWVALNKARDAAAAHLS
jgi:tetratricopeptide (TPR) repeat protein